MALPEDVERYIARKFAGAERKIALALLEAATIHDGSKPEPRLLRCAAVAGGGSMERLKMEIETLKRDWRDVIVEGEYVPQGRKLVRVRDLNNPIQDDT